MPGVNNINTLSVAPWANTEIIVAVIAVVGAIGGSAGLWDYLKARKRATITAREAEEAARSKAENAAHADAAAADELVTTALEIVRNGESRIEGLIKRHDAEMQKATARHDREMLGVNRRLDEQTARGDRLEIKVSELERESREQSRTIYNLRCTLTRIETWWSEHVVARWDEIRKHPVPPEFPSIRLD